MSFLIFFNFQRVPKFLQCISLTLSIKITIKHMLHGSSKSCPVDFDGCRVMLCSYLTGGVLYSQSFMTVLQLKVQHPIIKHDI